MTPIASRTVTGLCAAFSVMVVAPVAWADDVPPLVAHWRFDETGGRAARDDAGRYDGALVGGAAFVPGGISGNCVSLDKATNSLVDMGTSFPGFASGDFSIVAWVRTTASDTSAFAVSKHVGGTFNGYIVALDDSATYGQPNKAWFYVSAAPSQIATSTTSVNDGRWHQIVAVQGAGTVRIYVDGAPAEGTNAAPAMVTNAAPLLVGGYTEGTVPTGWYTGLVDDVQVYAGALTDAQVALLFSHPGRVVHPSRYDLVTDWSDTQNPTGTWIYREGTNALPRVAAWQRVAGGYSGEQPGWAPSEDGDPRTPFWHRSAGLETFEHDYQAGDVVVHTTSGGPTGMGMGDANVIWRSPLSGLADVTGGVWLARAIGRAADWRLFKNSTLLTQGSLSTGDAFDRASPFRLTAGSGGAAAVTGIAVEPGDLLELRLVTTSQFGDFVGVDFTVDVRDVTRVVSYLLPKTVKLKLGSAEDDDALVVAGFFDDGGATVDFAQPVTVEIGGYTTGPIALTAKGAAFVHKDANLSLTVKPRLKGSSRGSFKLTLKNATLGGLVDPAGEVALHLRAAGLPDAQGRVRLTSGAYALGKVRGALVAPAFFPAKAKVTANDGKPDVVAFTAGFAHEGPTPAALGRVRIALGSAFDRTIEGTAFTKTGDRFVHTESAGGASLSVTIDFAKEVVIVKAKGIEVGALAGPTEEFVFDLALGGEPVTTRVRLGSAGTKRFY